MLQLQIIEDDLQDLPIGGRELHMMFVASNYQARRIVRKLGMDDSLTGVLISAES
jgi:HD-like signal output (HDOD) protein